MLEYVRAQRQTEVDFITGVHEREAERLGVPAPLPTTMTAVILDEFRSSSASLTS